jgi:hypothetical protein
MQRRWKQSDGGASADPRRALRFISLTVQHRAAWRPPDNRCPDPNRRHLTPIITIR